MTRPAHPHGPDALSTEHTLTSRQHVIGRNTLDVRSLVCHAHLAMAIRCLFSFQRHCMEPHVLSVHDDGSLTRDDCDELRGRLRGVRIILKSEADDLIYPRLKNHPRCERYRREVVFGPKLLDMPLLCPNGYAYTDHDILFQRPFTGFGPGAREPADIVYMLDLEEAYSLNFRQRFLEKPRVRLPDRVNAGLMYVGAKAFDLDCTEWFLGLRPYQAQPFLIEQTAWAAMAARVNARYWNPEQVWFPSADGTAADRIALHFITPLRKAFASTPDSFINPRKPPVVLTTLPARYTSFPGMVVKKTIRKAMAG